MRAQQRRKDYEEKRLETARLKEFLAKAKSRVVVEICAEAFGVADAALEFPACCKCTKRGQLCPDSQMVSEFATRLSRTATVHSAGPEPSLGVIWKITNATDRPLPARMPGDLVGRFGRAALSSGIGIARHIGRRDPMNRFAAPVPDRVPIIVFRIVSETHAIVELPSRLVDRGWFRS